MGLHRTGAEYLFVGLNEANPLVCLCCAVLQWLELFDETAVTCDDRFDEL